MFLSPTSHVKTRVTVSSTKNNQEGLHRVMLGGELATKVQCKQRLKMAGREHSILSVPPSAREPHPNAACLLSWRCQGCHRVVHVIARLAANPPSAVSPCGQIRRSNPSPSALRTLLSSQPNTPIKALCCRFHSLYAIISRLQQLARPSTVPTPILPPRQLLPLRSQQSISTGEDTRTHRRKAGNRTKCSLERGWARSYPSSLFSRPATPSTSQVGPQRVPNADHNLLTLY